MTHQQNKHFNSYILFAPDGKIVSRGLRGEGIGRKMKEIFGE